MNLKKNEIEIIKLLISTSHYLTSYDIATATGINRRLVRDEMIHVKEILKSFNFELVSKTSKGYIIKGKCSESISKLEKIIADAERQRESVFPTLPIERRNYILKRLIDENDYIKIDELADELLISRSTISSDLKRVKHDIKKYHLSFRQKPNYGICIIGDEVDKRKPLGDYLFNNLNESKMFYDYLNSYITQSNSVENGIIDIIKRNHIEMSDITLCDFLICLSVSVSRIMLGHVITKSPDLSPIQGRMEFTVAKEIATFIENRIHCHFNEFEINQIAIQLICKRTTTDIKPRHEAFILATEILQEIKKQTLIDFNDYGFFSRFQFYIETVLLCVRYNEKIRHPLYDELKTTYPLAYELAEITASIIEKHIHQSLSMSLLAFFTTIFNTAINSQKPQKKKVLLLCGLDVASTKLNTFTIQERFGNQIDIVKTSQYYKIFEEDFSAYDFIISIVPIHNDLPIPHINISQTIDEDDLDKIENYLSYYFNKNRLEILFHPKLYKDKVKLKSLKSIITEFNKTLKGQYPSIKSLKSNIIMNDQKHFITFSHKIAVLKLNKVLNNNNILSVLLLEKPISYNKQDIQIIILFSCLDNNRYIFNTLTNILEILSTHPNEIDELLENPSYPHFLSLLKKYQ